MISLTRRDGTQTCCDRTIGNIGDVDGIGAGIMTTWPTCPTACHVANDARNDGDISGSIDPGRTNDADRQARSIAPYAFFGQHFGSCIMAKMTKAALSERCILADRALPKAIAIVVDTNGADVHESFDSSVQRGGQHVLRAAHRNRFEVPPSAPIAD